jgi:hypothetical protein
MAPEVSASGMQVERCPSCGARYNVSRLRPGAVFACRRCTARVRVGGDVEASSAPPRVGGPGLVIAGALAIGVPFLLANPGAGVSADRWPWEVVLDGDDASLCVTLGAWAVAGGLAIATGLARGGRTLLLLLAPLVAFLLARFSSFGAPGADAARVAWAALAAGGAVHLATRRDDRSAPARAMLACGALGLLASFAGDPASGGFFPDLWARANTFVTEVSGDDDARARAWSLAGQSIPTLCVLVACALALVVAIAPSAVRTVQRGLAKVVFTLFLVSFLASIGSALAREGLDVTGPQALRAISRIVAQDTLAGGALAWGLGAFVVAGLARAASQRERIAMIAVPATTTARKPEAAPPTKPVPQSTPVPPTPSPTAPRPTIPRPESTRATVPQTTPIPFPPKNDRGAPR